MKTSKAQAPSTREHRNLKTQTTGTKPRQGTLAPWTLKLGASLVLGAWCWALPSAHAQGTAFTYQGRLDDSGSPAGGFYDLRFTIYDLSTGGTPQGNTLTNAATAVSNGLFTVTLDFGPGVFTGPARWLEIGVVTNGGGAFTTLVPRQEVTPTPYAMYAAGANAAGLSGPVPASALGGTYGNAVTFNNGANSFNGSFFGQFFGSSFIGGSFVGNFIGTGAGLVDVNATTLDGLDATAFWQLNGNTGTTPGTHFVGTTDNQPLRFKVNNQVALRLEYPTVGIVPNLVGGHSGNSVSSGSQGAVIAGGFINHIGGDSDFSAIGGGQNNSVSNSFYATIAGGYLNEIGANSTYSGIGGGWDNQIASDALVAVIAGGRGNGIGVNSDYSAIGGGHNNNIATNSFYATIAGGYLNDIGAGSSFNVIGGGHDNGIAANTLYVTIAGGWGNVTGTGSDYSAIGGGRSNNIAANSWSATVAGGYLNDIGADAVYSAIGGGFDNNIANTAEYATIPGGHSNTATNYAFAAGHRAKANHTGAFVWADSTDADFASTANDQFLIRASGGVGINTNNVSGVALSVAGTVNATVIQADTFAGHGGGLTNVDAATLEGLDAAAFWKLNGNAGTTAGTHFLGTTDNQPLEIRVNGLRGWRLEDNGDSEFDPDAIPDGAPNVIGGSPRNYVAAGVVGAVIGGGGATNYSGTGYTNWIEANFAFVGGGMANRVLTGAQWSSIVGGNANIIFTNSFFSVVGGGQVNRIGDNASFATIAGGQGNNIASGSSYATIAGGSGNDIGAGASYAFAAGRQARANHQGAFIWADSTDADFASTAADQFLIRARGGVGIGTPSPAHTLDVEDSQAVARLNTTSHANGSVLVLKNSSVSQTYLGAINFETHSSTPGQIGYLTASGGQMTFRVGNSERMVLASSGNLAIDGTLSQGSDRNAKQDLRPVDALEVLARVTALPISTWAYTNSPSERHLGPMAQDFHAAFGLNGEADNRIATIDADGVALAAIQGLNVKLEDRSKKSELRVQKLEAENAELRQELQEIKQLLSTLTQKGNNL